MIRAKTTNVSLDDHSERVAAAMATLLDSPVITQRLQTAGVDITRQTLQRLAHFVGYHHDTGKASPRWQTAAENGETLPPHSHLSALYTLGVTTETSWLTTTQQTAAVLAVLHHHTNLTSRNMNPTNRPLRQLNTSPFDDVFMTNLVTAGFDEIQISDKHVQRFKQHLTTLRTGERNENEDVGVLTTVLYSALRQADQHVSAGGGQDTAELSVLDTADIGLFENLRPFQRRVEQEITEQMMGIAGCGEGKTHTALQWGRKLTAENQIDRLVIAMPTQVTGNNLLLELTKKEEIQHIPAEAAAVYHGDSNVFYQQNDDAVRWQTETPIDDETARKWFRSPVTITTVDHVLATLVNGYDGAGIARGNLLRAGIVFDEVHTYDDRLTNRIAGGLSRLSELEVPWYVMTATLPESIRSHHRFRPDVVHISEGRLGTDEPPRQPFTISLTEQALTAETVRTARKETDAQTTLVVKNTVREARELARRLHKTVDTDVLYYSSEFPRIDRIQKETQIRSRLAADATDAAILVSTQVCELSLDLSADLLLSELAPLDAILQRAGRLHRRGVGNTPQMCLDRSERCNQCRTEPIAERYECRVYSTLDEGERFLPYAEGPHSDMWTVLEQTADLLRQREQYDFRASMEWLDEVYDGILSVSGVEFEQCATTDMLLGSPRAVFDGAQDGERLFLRDPGRYRTPVFAAQYTLGDGRTGTPQELWKEFHECGESQCGVHDDTRWTSCNDEFRQFSQRLAIPVPSWWLHGHDDSPVREITAVTIDGTRIDTARQIDLTYEYSLGVETD